MKNLSKLFALLRGKLGAALAAFVSVFAVASASAFAAAPSVVSVPLDPTGGVMDTTQASVQTWVVTIGVPVLFGLILLGILIRLGTKWMKRAGRAV